MATPIFIKVVTDDNGTLSAATDAEVVVGRRDLVGDTDYPYDGLLATFKHDADGHYVNSVGDPANEPGEGEWLVVVRKKGRSLVAQKLTFTAKDGILRATPGWNEKNRETTTAATVSVVNFDQARSANPSASQSLVTIRLMPAQRFVGMGCRDNHGGTQFTLFAEGRRNQMFDEGTLNAGAIVTLFNCLTNETIVTVKGSKLSPTHWVVVRRVKLEGDTLGILEFYGELDAIGRADPGTVIEAGVYGHAWHQGPITQDTFDQSSDLSARDPADKDGRPKDWYPDGAVASDLPNLSQAFAAAGRMVIWGCSHMVNVVAEAREANHQLALGTPRTKFYAVGLDSGTLNTTLDYSKRNIAEYVLSQRVGRFPEQGSAAGLCTYGGRMAQALQGSAQCFVATPGMGANFGTAKGPKHKNGEQLSYQAMHIVDDGENFQLKKFFEREYGASYERDDHSYMNYSKFLGVSVVDPAWATERHIRYLNDAFNANFLRLPSGLEAARRKVGTFDAPVAFSQNGESGHLYIAQGGLATDLQIRGGLRLLIIEADSAFDLGLFVTQTGKTLLLERAKGKAVSTFALPRQLPTTRPMELVFDPKYKFPANDPGVPFTNNVIDQVTPQWFW